MPKLKAKKKKLSSVKKKKKEKIRFSESKKPYSITRDDKKGIVQGKHTVSDQSDRDNVVYTSKKTTEIPNPLNKKKPIIKIKKKKVHAQEKGKKGKDGRINLSKLGQTAMKGTDVELFGKKVYSKTKTVDDDKKAYKTKRKIEKEGLRLLKLKKKKEKKRKEK